MDHLRTWEVNFAYMEQGFKKSSLVKIRKLSFWKIIKIVFKYNISYRSVWRMFPSIELPPSEERSHKEKEEKEQED